VQSILNHSKRPSLGNRAPVTVFTGLPPDNPLRTMLPPQFPEQTCSLDFIQAQKVVKVDQLAAALENIHRDVATRRTRKREEAVAMHNAKTHVRSVNFELGDYVLVARQASKGHKLHVRWNGPF